MNTNESITSVWESFQNVKCFRQSLCWVPSQGDVLIISGHYCVIRRTRQHLQAARASIVDEDALGLNQCRLWACSSYLHQIVTQFYDIYKGVSSILLCVCRAIIAT